MADPFDAAQEVAQFLVRHSIPYVVIGGLAVQIWGRERLTRDADLTVPVSLTEGSEPIVRLVTGHFRSRISNPIDFARRNHLILITASNGIDVDISMALHGYEDELFARAVDFELALGQSIRLCSAEDLIIHKAVAGRPQDIIDIQGVVYRQGAKLDLVYTRYWLEQFAQALENPDVAAHFEFAWKRYNAE